MVRPLQLDRRTDHHARRATERHASSTRRPASGCLPTRASSPPSKVNEFRFGYNSLFNNISQELAGVENVNEKLEHAGQS